MIDRTLRQNPQCSLVVHCIPLESLFIPEGRHGKKRGTIRRGGTVERGYTVERGGMVKKGDMIEGGGHGQRRDGQKGRNGREG